MIDFVILAFQMVNLVVLLALFNEVMDLNDYLFFKEVVMDESDL